MDRKNQLLEFPGHGFFGSEKSVFDKLLGDGRTTLESAGRGGQTTLKVVEGGASDARQIYSKMFIKILIFGG